MNINIPDSLFLYFYVYTYYNLFKMNIDECNNVISDEKDNVVNNDEEGDNNENTEEKQINMPIEVWNEITKRLPYPDDNIRTSYLRYIEHKYIDMLVCGKHLYKINIIEPFINIKTISDPIIYSKYKFIRIEFEISCLYSEYKISIKCIIDRDNVEVSVIPNKQHNNWLYNIILRNEPYGQDKYMKLYAKLTRVNNKDIMHFRYAKLYASALRCISNKNNIFNYVFGDIFRTGREGMAFRDCVYQYKEDEMKPFNFIIDNIQSTLHDELVKIGQVE